MKMIECPVCGALEQAVGRGCIYCKRCNRVYAPGNPLREIECPECGTVKLSTSKTNARCIACNRTWTVAKAVKGRLSRPFGECKKREG